MAGDRGIKAPAPFNINRTEAPNKTSAALSNLLRAIELSDKSEGDKRAMESKVTGFIQGLERELGIKFAH